MRQVFAAVLWAGVSLVSIVGLGCLNSNDAFAARQAQKEWTLLVFLNGHNNLDRYGAININQMEQVGSTDDINVVVQWASTKNHPSATKRLYIQKDADPKKVTSPIVQELGKVDMGDWNNLVDFVKWAVENYPAKHYFIDVWNHGTGWHRTQLQSRGIEPMDISFDDETGNRITTAQLGQAMAEAAKIIGHKVDIYASDACLMGMAEVAQEMADSVEYFAGSEEVEPAAGWPYNLFLKRWAARPDATPAEITAILADEYVKSYSGGQNGNNQVNFSAFDLSKMGILSDAVAELGSQLSKLERKERQAVVDAASRSVNFDSMDYVDLGDFAREVESAVALDRGQLAGLHEAISEFVIVNRYTAKYAKAKGVAIWMPTRKATLKKHLATYKELKFDGLTQWSAAIEHVLQDASEPPVWD